ncbi:hypothetical protein SAMN05444722_2184 [Rhodovulum sp. ES.010]|uniref:helix-turn-helix domain-containing protein n=1 Tax=Rhodovulum sp. ES.010 TaxID=1882821 RepID=UPI000926227B|nr:helix-turn-helix domain-containing protein [Rhodovulum sp. ES.010]SIO44344.1 hypothetical protein SAMN05444722_2184 [Rhodovulum sp. ES.010]
MKSAEQERLAGVIEALAALRLQMDGDLDRALILLTLFIAAACKERASANLNAREDTLNASVIARITGIPRESVRRKLEAMREDGWVVRDAESNWCVAQSSRRSITELYSPLMDLGRPLLASPESDGKKP